MHKFKQLALLAISLIALRSAVSAQVTYVSNTSLLGGAQNDVNVDTNTSVTGYFWTGGTSAAIDTLFFPAVTGQSVGGVTLSLYSQNDQLGLLATFNPAVEQSSSSNTYAGYSFSLLSPISLSSNTFYYWTMSSTSGTLNFMSYESDDEVSGYGWQLGNNYFVNSGSVDRAINMSISNSTASAIPEPSTYAMIAGATMLVGTVIYRRRKAA